MKHCKYKETHKNSLFFTSSGWTFAVLELIGKMESWSSNTKHLLQSANERIRRSLNLQVIFWCDSVLNLLWTSMAIVKSWLRDDTVFKSMMMMPPVTRKIYVQTKNLDSHTGKLPPSTVSIVRANIFGVSAKLKI